MNVIFILYLEIVVEYDNAFCTTLEAFKDQKIAEQHLSSLTGQEVSIEGKPRVVVVVEENIKGYRRFVLERALII